MVPSEATIDCATAPGEPQRLKTDWKHIFSLREMGVYYALLLLVLVLSMTTTYLGRANYLSLLNVTNVLYQASLIGIMAVAMTVILISGNFDLSVASVAALSAAVFVGNADAIGFWPAFAVAMTVAIGSGLLNGAIVQFLGINAFIVTLGTMTALRGVVLLYTNGYALSVENTEVIAAMQAFESGRINVGFVMLALGILFLGCGVAMLFQAQKRSIAVRPAMAALAVTGVCLLALSWTTNLQLMLPKPVLYLFAFTAIAWFTLTFTMVGRRLYAVGGNAEAARLSGINVLRYKILAFVLCSASAGFAGILFASRLRSINPGGLSGAELTVIAAAILGGTSLFGGAGSVIKTLAGALLLFSLSNGFNILNLGANYQGLIEGIVVVVAAAIYTVGGKNRAKTLGAKTQ
ncbi:UNVERIFIED_ORG: D-xylose transport system permease protein [Rhizobium sophorae]|uniref:ABC transporter permease n=1 Tax=Rhizobium leguminosarum TaxID=384 RepID=UPI00180CAA93|nr:ABC transporter permease [Rhizobium leguminosarum]MBB4524917.1 D-xylose transport system permease protein [Rhizobium leguminosarum]MDH6661902.1 D-xylose transport system permease protein [Rhizobium sophorae]